MRRLHGSSFPASIGPVLVCWLALVSPAANAQDAEPVSDECRAFQEDVDADLGDVLGAGCQPSLAQMSRLMDNPLGNVAMWINQFDWWRLTNDDVSRGGESQYNYMGIFQFPKGVSENWNVINRIVYNVPSVPLSQSKIDAFGANGTFLPAGGGPAQPPAGRNFLPIDVFSGRTTGFGDMYYVGLLSPKESIKHGPGKISVWGLGLDLAFPTASEDLLGDGKFSAGPSALYAYMGPKWKLGGLAQQYFSYAGDGDRDDVNLTNLQYFVYYSLTDTISIGAGPNIIANWEASSGNKFTVPIGLGINRTFQLGKVPVRIGVEFHYNVVRPDSVGADWNFRTYIIPAVPSALFGWMK